MERQERHTPPGLDQWAKAAAAAAVVDHTPRLLVLAEPADLAEAAVGAEVLRRMGRRLAAAAPAALAMPSSSSSFKVSRSGDHPSLD